MSKLTSLVLLLALPMQIFAWGREGHHIIALLAQSRLNETAKAKIIELLGTETLTQASTWPDEIRKDHPETAGWHYVSIPRAAPFFDQARDCFQPDPTHPGSDADHHNCVVDRIDLYARVLLDAGQPKSTRVEALKYLVHFLSDLHQPMHAIQDARGGNDIKVVQFGSATCGGEHTCNLHGLWDSGLIEHAESDELAYMHHLEVLIARENLDSLPEGTPADWANESHVMAVGAMLDNGGLADQVYFNHEISNVNHRLALAGIRLSHMLNEIFAPTSTTVPPTHEASGPAKY